MSGRKYWVESLLSEPSAKKRWAEGSTRFPVLGVLCRVHIIFQAKDARQISTPCHETSAPEAVRGEGNASCPNLEPKIRSLGLICPNLRPIYHRHRFLTACKGTDAACRPKGLPFRHERCAASTGTTGKTSVLSDEKAICFRGLGYGSELAGAANIAGNASLRN